MKIAIIHEEEKLYVDEGVAVHILDCIQEMVCPVCGGYNVVEDSDVEVENLGGATTYYYDELLICIDCNYRDNMTLEETKEHIHAYHRVHTQRNTVQSEGPEPVSGTPQAGQDTATAQGEGAGRMDGAKPGAVHTHPGDPQGASPSAGSNGAFMKSAPFIDRPFFAETYANRGRKYRPLLYDRLGVMRFTRKHFDDPASSNNYGFRVASRYRRRFCNE